MKMKLQFAALVMAAALFPVGESTAAELKVLTAGAMKEVVLSVIPEFEKQTRNKVTISNDTAGALLRRIQEGEAFDVVVVTPAALEELAGKGKVAAGSRTALARVGVGVVVKEGAAVPDIGTVEAFKGALLAAKSVAYIDPASGGSSGVYFVRLIERLGIADQIKAKAKLKQGGYVADLIASGEAELGVHQISEILPVKGVVLVGPLPRDIQNYTTYAAAVGGAATDGTAAAALIRMLAGPAAEPTMKSRGMERPSP
jgi:molybdate transport system substrate-binding protein